MLDKKKLLKELFLFKNFMQRFEFLESFRSALADLSVHNSLLYLQFRPLFDQCMDEQ